MNEVRRNGHGNVGRHGRSSGDSVAEMRVERLNVRARTDRAQIHRDAAFLHCKFFGSSHEFAAEAFSLVRGIDAEKTEIHAVGFFLEIDATDKSAGFFEQQELAGAQIFQCTFAVDAIGTDERALHFKRRVDEPGQRAGFRLFCNANRKKFSSTKQAQEKIERPGNFAAVPSSSSMRRS